MTTPTPSQPQELRPLAFPERLRPRPVRRRARRRLSVLYLLLPLLLLPLIWWKIQRVEVTVCPGLPEEVRLRLGELVGSSPLTLDLQQVRQQVESWPGVASVEVRLELPGTLFVIAHPQPIAGSLAVGRSWHAVAADGALGRALEEPQPPLLQGFGRVPAALRLGLEIAARISTASGYSVQQVRMVMPGDVELLLAAEQPEAETVVIRVNSGQASAAEQLWCRQVREGWQPAPWTDLRMDDRLVVRVGSP